MICILLLKNLKKSFDLHLKIIYLLKRINCNLQVKILKIYIVQLKLTSLCSYEKSIQSFSCIYLHNLSKIKNVTLPYNHLICDLTQKQMFYIERFIKLKSSKKIDYAELPTVLSLIQFKTLIFNFVYGELASIRAKKFL